MKRNWSEALCVAMCGVVVSVWCWSWVANSQRERAEKEWRAKVQHEMGKLNDAWAQTLVWQDALAERLPPTKHTVDGVGQCIAVGEPTIPPQNLPTSPKEGK